MYAPTSALQQFKETRRMPDIIMVFNHGFALNSIMFTKHVKFMINCYQANGLVNLQADIQLFHCIYSYILTMDNYTI